MIAVKVGYENLMDPGNIEAKLPQTDLGTFPAVYQKKPPTCMQQMSGRESF
jgi:hypothetical protein